jgi:hypothetical protein
MRCAEGWHIVSIKGGDQEGGVTAHRGVLHPDEYVDKERVLFEAENRLGFTLADLWDVYCQGPKDPDTRQHRARIDARLLEVAEAGGNMELLARVLDLDRKTIGRALARARQVWKED